MLPKSRSLIWADGVFIVSILLFFILIGLTFRTSQDVAKSNEIEERTFIVLGKLERLLSQTLDIETGSRGYAITGNEEFLQPYLNGRESAWITLDSLRELVVDPDQNRRLDTLDILLREKLAIADTIVTARASLGSAFVFEYITQGDGKRMMDSIRSVLRRAVNTELLLLAERSSTTDEKRAARGRYFIFLSLMALFLIVMAYIVMRRNMRKLQETRQVQQDLIDELSYQNKQLDDFASITSHNVRGPAATMSMLVDFVEPGSTVKEYQETLEKMRNVSNNLLNTLEELMNVLQVKKNKTIERTELSFLQVFSKEKENLEGSILLSNAVIEGDFAVSTIWYPKVYLESIFHNLISNALKYRSPDRNPVIQVKTEQRDGHVFLNVSDNGLGMDLAKYGDKLFGLRKTFHPHPDARGIGLFMTKVQIEALGGKISVKSKEGEGTTFTVRF